MSVSLYKIKKWYKMLAGKSISHVNQGVGTCFSKNEVAGYYNDLTEKVTRDDPDILVPKYHVDTGEEIYFSIGIFQYGLAAYDLYLKSGEKCYKEKLLACADWAVDNQQDDGSWVTFAYENPEHPYSAMAQGEGISMLLRAHIVSGDERYMTAAQKAKDFMLKPITEGGTTDYHDGLIFYEYTHLPVVLNGWIFSIFGVFDLYLATQDSKYKDIFDLTVSTLERNLPAFDNGYWSMYDLGNQITSPFYHRLHIALLQVLFLITNKPIFFEYASRWDSYEKSRKNKLHAFFKKATQKIME